MNELLPNISIDQLGMDFLYDQANEMMDTVLEYKNMMMEYSCAIREIKTKFEVLQTEFSAKNDRNPISSIHTRLKSQSSIVEKMVRKGIPISQDNIRDNLNDIAGIRVVCSYIDDIYMLADALCAQDDIEVIDRKDYIAHPKENGYRSLHLIVSVPVFFANESKKIKAEVQIRTIAMDFWASLEHDIKYKKNAPNAAAIISGLKECAEAIAENDEKMLELRKQMDRTKDTKNRDDDFMNKLKRLDKMF